MLKSIRFRLLLWSAAVLLAVVGGFATILFYEIKSARLSEIDAQLDSAATALDASLRVFPRHEITGEPAPRPMTGPGGRGGPGGPGRGGPGGPGGPGRRDDRPDGPRPPPPGERTFSGPDGEPLRPPFGPNGERMMPGMARELLLSQLTLPPSAVPDEGVTYFAIWRTDGAVLKSAGPVELVAKPPASVNRRPVTTGETRELRVNGPHDSVILVGRPVGKVADELAALRWQLWGTGTVVLAVGLFGGWLVSRRIFRPVTTIAATAARISGDNLSERIDEGHIDLELRDLARTLNGTFDRLESAFDRQARFTADASHELRTPLAVIRGQAELALLRERSPDEYKAALASCQASAERMTDLVERLLALARADAGWPGLAHDSVAFDALVADVASQLTPMAGKKGVSLKVRAKPARVTGDASVLGQLVTNLITNAITYNRPGGKVRVAVDPVDGGISFTVADTGLGISAEDRDRLFERFFRVDQARTRASGGTGLGLAICKAIVDAHGGWIDVKSAEGKGSEFRVWFPAGQTTAEHAAHRKPKGVERPVRGPHERDVRDDDGKHEANGVPEGEEETREQTRRRDAKQNR
jgi:two-component system OmpR family sensor kinase